MIASLNAHNMLFYKDFLHILSLSKTKLLKKNALCELHHRQFFAP